MRTLALCFVALLAVGCGDDDSGPGGSGGTAGSGGSGGDGGAGGTGGSEAPLLDEYVLEDEMLVPESGTFDSVGRNFYVGSATEGSVTRVAADGAEEVFFEPEGDNWRTLGMVADVEARRLWVCAQRTDPVEQQIWVLDLDSGVQSLVLDIQDDAAADGTCNDVALDAGGLAYVSDSSNPRIYRADAEEESITTWADDPLLGPDGGSFGGNGIAVTEDDAFVLLSKTFASQMSPRFLRINRADPSDIEGIATTPELAGTADGMSFLDGVLYLSLVAEGDVLRIASDDDWATATIASTAAVSGTSTVRPAEGRLYAIYSDITNSLLGLPLNPPFRIFEVDLNSFE